MKRKGIWNNTRAGRTLGAKAYRCVQCDYLVSAEQLTAFRYDYGCPRCGLSFISFVPSFIFELTEDTGDAAKNAQRPRGGKERDMSFKFKNAHECIAESWERVRIILKLDEQLRFHSQKMLPHASYPIAASTITDISVPTAMDISELENQSNEDVDEILKRRFLDELIETRNSINEFLRSQGR